MTKLNDYDVGVIVGRFQIPILHEAHQKIISEVVSRHKKCIVFVGASPTLGTKEHPLDFVNRKVMIEKVFPTVVVLPIADVNNDELWSKNLDSAIRVTYPQGSVVLYGGRDSFVKHYTGKFDAYEFPTHDYRPATEIRAEIGRTVINSDDFRAGVIYSTQNQFKRTHLTIDVLLYDKTKGVLLGRKRNEKNFRFIGGFVEGETLEAAVIKEAKEEAGVDLFNMKFLGSSVISDWRYQYTSDSVLTSLFAAEVDGTPVAGDDIVEVKWFSFEELYSEVDEDSDEDSIFVDSHRKLFKELGQEFIGSLCKSNWTDGKKKGKK